nr:transporter substrate-binding domain-containing protein [Paraburkholderia sacchari]
MNIGYVADARPYAFQNSEGQADGYAVALCRKIADKVKADLSLPALAVNWTVVKPEERYRALQDHRIDLLCADAETLTGRQYISYSIPVYPGGLAALTRADAPAGLKEVLSGSNRSDRPIWRASPAQLLNAQTFSTVEHSPTQLWLAERMGTFQLSANVITASSYEDGVRQVLERKAGVFFAERAILQDQVSRNPAGDQLQILHRRFSYAPISLGVARGDEDLRLLVDRTLSRVFKSGDYRTSYVKWFGQPDEDAQNFYRLAILPD